MDGWLREISIWLDLHFRFMKIPFFFLSFFLLFQFPIFFVHISELTKWWGICVNDGEGHDGVMNKA